MKKLSEIQKNKSANIIRLEGSHHFISRILAVGFTPSASLEVIKNDRVGPLLIYIRDTKIAIGRKEAQHIIVEEK